MNRNRLLFIGIVALLVAGLLTVLAYRATIAKAGLKPRSARVVVAANDMTVGAKIEADDLRETELPEANLPAGFFSDSAKVVGRGVITSIAKNELILESKIAGEKAGAGLPAMIPPKMRAVSVKVNDVISVAGFVTPGTRVDVLLTGSPTNSPNSPDVMTTTVLENVEVLAAGQKIEPNSEGKAEKVPVITLLVTPDDAQKLTLASTQGKIQLSLRNPLDGDKQNTIAVKNVSLYKVLELQKRGNPGVKRAARKEAAPPPPPVQVYMMEIIRGEKKEVTKF